jgi:hypothetical protein
MNFLIVTFLIILLIKPSINLNKISYTLERNRLKNLETHYHTDLNLNKQEKIVNLYFQYLKKLEYESTRNKFLPALPIENNFLQLIQRPLYSILRELPKGGNLHVHDSQMLDRKLFLNLIKNDSSLYNMLYICDKLIFPECKSVNNDQIICNCTSYTLSYFMKNVPLGWSKVNFKYFANRI